MVINNQNSSFEWLRQECRDIRSQRFHIFEALNSDDFCFQSGNENIKLRGDYIDFMREFGVGKFFTDYRDAPTMTVYSLKEYRRHEFPTGEAYIGFGDNDQKSFCFSESEVIAGLPLNVFLVNRKTATKVNANFSEWLRLNYELVRAKFSAAQWKKIIAGPKPFTNNELAIVEARSKFHWSHTGFAPNGDAIFKVHNGSALSLPYLSIGVQGKGGSKLVGGAWLEISHINPGETGYTQHDCYKEVLLPDELELFQKLPPIREKRDGYWEFKKLPF